MGVYASDIETTGLIEDMELQENPKLHNLGAINMNTGKETCFSNHFNVLKERICEDMRPLDQLQDWLDEGHTLIMHNGITFDGEALKFLGYSIDNIKILDTLPISWYLRPKDKRHGLELWGERFGVPKPPVTDWINGEQEVYNNRVMMDCRIQYKLWKLFDKELKAIYSGEPQKLKEFIGFLMFKMEQQRVQQLHRWKLNIGDCTTLLKELEADKEERITALAEAMPPKVIREVKNIPKKPFKKDRSLSATGIKWVALCKAAGREPFVNGELQDYDITIIKDRLKGNPNSVVQIKTWLFSLGWVPETFKYVRDKETGEVREVPQISIEKSGGKICPSIDKLIDKHPEAGLHHLKGLGIIRHRLGLCKGFLENVRKDGTIVARCAGLTNTLRLKHSVLVNLPSTRVPYGERMRALFYFDGEYENLGSDLSSLEDRVKHHFQWPYDPEYVKKQMAEDYDPHLDICLTGGMLTQEEVAGYKAKTLDEFKMNKIAKVIRPQGKATNYSCQYGAGGATVARAAGVDVSTGNMLKDTYWKLNWSINEIADSCTVKTVNIDGKKTKYLKNPINGFWYWLKADKDKFSTLCQGTGAYVFDIWVKYMYDECLRRFNRLLPLVAQFHDEVILRTKKGEKSQNVWMNIVKGAIQGVNNQLSLNRDMDCDVQFGKDYSEIH